MCEISLKDAFTQVRLATSSEIKRTQHSTFLNRAFCTTIVIAIIAIVIVIAITIVIAIVIAFEDLHVANQSREPPTVFHMRETPNSVRTYVRIPALAFEPSEAELPAKCKETQDEALVQHSGMDEPVARFRLKFAEYIKKDLASA